MKIEGSYSFAAARDMVWAVLKDPQMLQHALPGCGQVDQLSADHIEALLQIDSGPFSGEFRGTVRIGDVRPGERVCLYLEGMGPEGPVKGNGCVEVHSSANLTTVNYSGEIAVTGTTAARSPRLVLTTANSLIRRYFSTVDDHIRIQTRIHTTSIPASNDPARHGSLSLAHNAHNKLTNRLVVAGLSSLTLFALFSIMQFVKRRSNSG